MVEPLLAALTQRMRTTTSWLSRRARGREDAAGDAGAVEPDAEVGGGALDGDPVGRAAPRADHAGAFPPRRQAGVEAEAVPLRAHAEDVVGDDAVEPGRRAGVPGPAAAAVVRRGRPVDVAREDVRLGPVGLRSLRAGLIASSRRARVSASRIAQAAAIAQVAAWV